MDLIDLKRNLKSHDVKHSTIMKIIIKIQSIPEFHKLKMDVELCLLVCNLIENSVEKNLQMPKIGQNTLSILSQLGYSDEQVKEFIKEKIVEADNVEKINSKL